MKRNLSVLFLVAAVAGCGNPAPMMMMPTGSAVVTSRDSMNTAGTINTVDINTQKVTKAIDTTLDSDHVIHVSGDKAYLLNRVHNTLRVYDTKDWTVKTEIALGGGGMSFPQDALPVPSSTQVIITFNGNPGATAVGIVDTDKPTMGVISSIAVPVATADLDGKPEPSALYYCKGLFYTGLSDYDSIATFSPTGPGRVAVIDPAKTTAEVIQLTVQNPTNISAASSADCGTVFVAGLGPFGTEPDNRMGLERVDLAGKKSLGVVFDGSTLHGAPGTVVLVNSTRAIMVLFYDLQTVMGTFPYKILARARLVAFNPTDGTVIGDASEKTGFIPFLGLAPTGDIWFGADNFASVDTTGNLPAGLYIGKSDAKIGGTPIDIGQTPVAIDFKVP